MKGMGVYDQIRRAFQDLIAPELHAIRGELRLLDQKIDGLDREVRTAIDIRERLATLEARRGP